MASAALVKSRRVWLIVGSTVATVVLLVVGVRPGCTFGRGSTAGLAPGDAVVVLVKSWLQDREAFDAANYAAAPAPGEDEAAYRLRLSKGLADVRSDLPTNGSFSFVDGEEFRFAGTGAGAQRVMAVMKGEDVQDPSMFTLPARWKHQAYVIFRTTGASKSEFEIHILAVETDEGWKLLDLHLMVTGPAGKDVQRATAVARSEATAGRHFEALALYSLALASASGPGYRVTGVQHRLQPEVAKTLDSLNAGANGAVGTVQTKEGRWPVKSLRTVRIAGAGCFLEANLETVILPDGKEIEDVQARIAEAIRSKHPELEKYFDGLAVSMVATGPPTPGQGYRSLHPFKPAGASAGDGGGSRDGA